MRIDFYESFSPTSCVDMCVGWHETEDKIASHIPLISTVQMGLLSTMLIEMGYRLFIHEANGSVYEIKLGKNERTGREIKPGHNLFKLWMNGEFSCDA